MPMHLIWGFLPCNYQPIFSTILLKNYNSCSRECSSVSESEHTIYPDFPSKSFRADIWDVSDTFLGLYIRASGRNGIFPINLLL